MKHFFVLAVLLTSPFLSSAQQIDTLINWSNKNPKWIDDENDVAYVASRCGVLYSMLGAHFLQNGNSKEDKSTGEELTTQGKHYSMVGLVISTKNGMSNENALKRYELFASFYATAIKQNKTAHNNIFYGNTEKDFDFCVKFSEWAKKYGGSPK